MNLAPNQLRKHAILTPFFYPYIFDFMVISYYFIVFLWTIITIYDSLDAIFYCLGIEKIVIFEVSRYLE